MDTQTHRQQGDLISVLLYFQNKESILQWPIKRALNGENLKYQPVS
jgi:hypothetical protein